MKKKYKIDIVLVVNVYFDVFKKYLKFYWNYFLCIFVCLLLKNGYCIYFYGCNWFWMKFILGFFIFLEWIKGYIFYKNVN